MAKNKDTFNIEDARIALDALEEKLELLTEVVEEKLTEKKSQRAPSTKTRAPSTKTKVSVVEMPNDIEVDTNDKYNTQPKNSALHHYGKNYRMFRRDAMHNVMHSKMFWIMLVILPVIMTFIEFVLTGWGIANDFVLQSGLGRVCYDLLNWFMIMPILLLSLIVFPTFIAMSRENNQLKRYSMKGMSRRQIYWAYIRFSIMFLFVLIFVWMAIWVPIMNLAANSIWMDDGTIEHLGREKLFRNPWGIFFGTEFVAVHWADNFNISQLTWGYNMITVEGLGATDFDTFFSAYAAGEIDLSMWVDNAYVYNNLVNVVNTGEIKSWLLSCGVELDFKNYDYILEIVLSMPRTYEDAVASGIVSDYGYVSIGTTINYFTPEYYEGINAIVYFTFLVLFMFGVNSVGFNKAMKVTSSRSLMGWGIGLWLFASIVQGSTTLLYNDLYTFNAIDGVWNYVVMILLMILKWMFIFSPITIMIVGLTLVTGFIEQPEVVKLGEFGQWYQQWYSDMYTVIGGNEFFNTIHSYFDVIQQNEYDPLINPQTTTYVFVGISAFWAVMWTIKTWMFKSRIVSYEAAR